MQQQLFNRITQICDKLKETNQKLSVSNIVNASLFSAGGTLAGFEREVKTVKKDYYSTLTSTNHR